MALRAVGKRIGGSGGIRFLGAQLSRCDLGARDSCRGRGAEEFLMTIGKKLYFGFGAILSIMLVLFFINVITVRREYSAQNTVKATLATKQALDNARSQMMQDRLYLSNYLLSGDLRDEDKTNKGVGDLLALLKDAETKVSDPALRNALAQVGDTESSWSENFAKPMIAKRHQVD